MKTQIDKFVGLSLSGGKNSRTYLCHLDYYKKEKKTILSTIHEAPAADKTHSADARLIEILKAIRGIKDLGFDVPLQLPKCMRAKAKGNGYEKCDSDAMDYIDSLQKKMKKKKMPTFSPYTERVVEYYINSLGYDFYMGGALGSNYAPLTARAFYLQRLLPHTAKEVFPRLTFWRLGKSLGLAKKYLSASRLSPEGEEARLHFFQSFMKKDVIFMYHQDVQLMIENPYAFDAFLVAFTLFLEEVKKTEKKPKDFPKGESWILYPEEEIFWESFRI